MILTLQRSFSSAHFYNQPAWSKEQNEKTFGACYTEYGHGHNYTLQVSFKTSFETYNQDQHAPLLQSAIHYSILPNILTFEASIGQRLNTFRERWFGFGLSFTP